MSIEEVPMYRVVCDGPGCAASAQDETDYWGWADSDAAVDDAKNAGWLVTEDGKHYCEDHSTWSENEDARVPLLEVAP